MLRGAQDARPLQGVGAEVPRVGRPSLAGYGDPRGAPVLRGGRNLRAAGWHDAAEKCGLAQVLGAGRGS